MILFILLNIIYLFIYFYKDKMGRGGTGFPLPPPRMGAGIPLPTPKLSGTHGFPLPLPFFKVSKHWSGRNPHSTLPLQNSHSRK